MTKYEWRDIALQLGLCVPIWKAHALDYLESAGYRFLVDFGTENAVDKAREHWCNRRRSLRGRTA